MEKPLFEELYEIFTPYPEKMEVIRAWEKDYRIAAIKNNLYEHEAVKQLVGLMKDFIAKNEATLQTQKRSDYANDNNYFDVRTKLEAENSVYRIIISFFTMAKSQTESIEKTVGQAHKNNKK